MSARAQLRSLAVAIAMCMLAMCTLVASCGQSGPLTLPEATSATGVQSEATPQDNEQEEDEQD